MDTSDLTYTPPPMLLEDVEPSSDPVPDELHHLIISGELERLLPSEEKRRRSDVDASLPPEVGERHDWDPTAATPMLTPLRTLDPLPVDAAPTASWRDLLLPVFAGAMSAVATVLLGVLALGFTF